MSKRVAERNAIIKWCTGLIIILLYCLNYNSKALAEEIYEDDLDLICYEHKDYKSYFYYNDEMMLSDKNKDNDSEPEPSDDLAKISMGISLAAYTDDIHSDTEIADDHIESVFSQMGYDLVGGKTYNYDRIATYEDNDFVAYAIGKKPINNFNVYIVAIRGTNSDAEWFSDFRLYPENGEQYETDYHYGFWAASNEVIHTICQNVSGSNNIFLITGHSRGAAVANIVAGRLTKEYSLATPDHIYGYTFACPSVRLNADNSLDNIWNFNNPGDTVAAIPLNKWDYGRYGRDVNLSTQTDIYENFKNRFKDVMGQEYGALLYTADFTSALERIVKKPEDFKTIDTKMLFDVVSWAMAEWDSVILNDMIKAYTNKYLSDISYFVHYNLTLVRTVTGFFKFLLKDGPGAILQTAADAITVEDSLLKDRIQVYLDDTAQMTNSQFADLINDNEDFANLCEEIKNRVGLEINSRNDLSNAFSELTESTQFFSSWNNDLRSVLNLFCSTDLSVKTALEHSHQPETYDIWINSMFFGCEGWKNNDSITDINWNLMDTIDHIGYHCFEGCDGIIEVDFPSFITKIEDWFYNCYNLRTVKIHNNQVIMDRAFYKMTLDLVSIPVDYEYLEKNGIPFYESSVTKIHYTMGKTGIMKDRLFESGADMSYLLTLEYNSIPSLEAVEFEDSITHIGDYTFYGCMPHGCLPEDYGKISSIKWPKCLVSIGSTAFAYQRSLAEVVIPDLVEEIPDGCFECCDKLSKVCIPNSVNRIGCYAFGDCPKLNNVIIPNSVREIDIGAFFRDYALDSLIMNTTKCDLYYSVFSETTIDRFEITDEMTLHGGAFSGMNLEILKIPVDYYYLYENGEPFRGAEIKKVVYKKGKTGIMPDRLSGDVDMSTTLTLEYWCADSIESAVFEDGITYIGRDAYNGSCVHRDLFGSSVTPVLKNVELPDSLLSIGEWAFNSQRSLTEVVLPGTIEKLGDSCFSSTGISTIYIPETVKLIGDFAFSLCWDLRNVYIFGDIEKAGIDAFFDCGLEEVYIYKDIKMIGYECFGTLVNPGTSTSRNDKVVIYGRYGSNIEKYSKTNSIRFCYIPCYDHDWDGGILEKEPSCIEQGKITYTCKLCGETRNESIDIVPHTVVIDAAIPPTCIETGLTEGSHCSVCGCVLKKQELIDAIGHSMVIDPAIEPTQTETGLTEGSHCSVCGEVIVAQEVIPKKSSGSGGGGYDVHIHIWDNGRVTKEPTCTDEGVMTYTCEGCEETKTEAIPAMGHTIVVDLAVAATEATDGLTEGSHCSVCGKVIVKQQVVPMLTSKDGWILFEGKWYLYRNGRILTGWQNDDGKWYYLNKEGVMHIGWKKLGGKWYYMNSSGAMQTGWKKIAGKWYFFKNSGAMASNEWCGGYWLSRNGAWTYQARGSWHKSSKGWWYSDTSGWFAKSAWYMIDGVWYYFDVKGYSVTGVVTINGVEYTFDDSGAWVR